MHPANVRTGLFYDWAGALYFLVEPWLRTGRKRLVTRVNAEQPGRVLEVGVGTGGHLPLYRDHQVTGIDVSPRMLQRARKAAEGSGATLALMDGEQLAFADGSFDAVVLCHVLSVTESPERMLAEAWRVLRAGGKVYISNHETPAHAGRHLDRLTSLPARLLRLRTWFRLAEIPGWGRFQMLHQEQSGLGGWSKLVVLGK